MEIVSAEFERIPNDYKDVTPEQREAVEKLLARIEDDEDNQNVFPQHEGGRLIPDCTRYSRERNQCRPGTMQCSRDGIFP